ncbi:MAG: DUF6508 domain-containing protein [Deltaproteobacteria bacterium]|nr:DUF6508 domain-containing protein [Deltaproteobacteria bacterium]
MSQKTRLPDAEEIAALVAFLPVFEAEGFVPIPNWHAARNEGGEATSFPWPIYDPAVDAFFRLAGKEPWCDYGYRPEVAGELLADLERVGRATLEEVRSMITFCVRGERFCDGHWGGLIEDGRLQRLLRRLAELSA